MWKQYALQVGKLQIGSECMLYGVPERYTISFSYKSIP